jgi:hypothetical protein
VALRIIPLPSCALPYGQVQAGLMACNVGVAPTHALLAAMLTVTPSLTHHGHHRGHHHWADPAQELAHGPAVPGGRQVCVCGNTRNNSLNQDTCLCLMRALRSLTLCHPAPVSTDPMIITTKLAPMIEPCNSRIVTCTVLHRGALRLSCG